jgi:glucokinase
LGKGLGNFSKGRLFSGGQGLGGEIGHFVVNPGGDICSCGGQGCIQTVVSEKVVIRKAREIATNGVHTIISDWVDHASEIEAAHIYRAAEAGDRFALNLLEPVLSILGRTVGGVCSLLNPTLVVLGKVSAAYPGIWEPIKEIIRRSTLPYIGAELDIRFSSIIQNGGLIGTTELVVERLFYPVEAV